MTDVFIPKSKWLRGGGDASFLNAKGQSCGLGHVLLACGVPPADLLDQCAISSMRDTVVLRFVPEPLYEMLPISQKTIGSNLSVQIVETNDNEGITDEERQAKLALFLAPLDFTPIFVEDTDASQSDVAQ